MEHDPVHCPIVLFLVRDRIRWTEPVSVGFCRHARLGFQSAAGIRDSCGNHRGLWRHPVRPYGHEDWHQDDEWFCPHRDRHSVCGVRLCQEPGSLPGLPHCVCFRIDGIRSYLHGFPDGKLVPAQERDRTWLGNYGSSDLYRDICCDHERALWNAGDPEGSRRHGSCHDRSRHRILLLG